MFSFNASSPRLLFPCREGGWPSHLSRGLEGGLRAALEAGESRAGGPGRGQGEAALAPRPPRIPEDPGTGPSGCARCIKGAGPHHVAGHRSRRQLHAGGCLWPGGDLLRVLAATTPPWRRRVCTSVLEGGGCLAHRSGLGTQARPTFVSGHTASGGDCNWGQSSADRLSREGPTPSPDSQTHLVPALASGWGDALTSSPASPATNY